MWQRVVVLLEDQLGEGEEMARESAFHEKQCSGERDAGFVIKRTLERGSRSTKITHMNLLLNSDWF